MRLKVLSSSSEGNCYLLENENQCLVIEAGVKFKEVMQAIDFDIGKIKGCILTHEHKDHSKYVKDFIENGINVYASKGTIEAIGLTSHRLKCVEAKRRFSIGWYTIVPFNVKHDAAEPIGFYINHPETGNIVFATDTYYMPNKFEGMHNVLIECNYSSDILNENMINGQLPKALKDRVIQSHMELETCKGFFKANDIRQINKIVLLHLSSGNSNAEQFKREIAELTGKEVCIADKGLDIDFNRFKF